MNVVQKSEPELCLSMNTTLEQIIGFLWITDPGSQGWQPRTSSIPLNELREWIKSEDIEVLGHLYLVLNDSRFHIDPPLSRDEYQKFATHYYERCLLENPEGEWSDNRYSAGWDIVRWFVQLWDDAQVTRSTLIETKEWLGKLYKEGDEALRKCIVTATVEHLFERKEIREFFTDWENDPVLKPAYEEGILWVTRGGASPLSER
jgi:hypothetical protein